MALISRWKGNPWKFIRKFSVCSLNRRTNGVLARFTGILSRRFACPPVFQRAQHRFLGNDLTSLTNYRFIRWYDPYECDLPRHNHKISSRDQWHHHCSQQNLFTHRVQDDNQNTIYFSNASFYLLSELRNSCLHGSLLEWSSVPARAVLVSKRTNCASWHAGVHVFDACLLVFYVC